MDSPPALETVYQAIYSSHNHPNTSEQQKSSLLWLEELQKSVRFFQLLTHNIDKNRLFYILYHFFTHCIDFIRLFVRKWTHNLNFKFLKNLTYTSHTVMCQLQNFVTGILVLKIVGSCQNCHEFS